MSYINDETRRMLPEGLLGELRGLIVRAGTE